MAQEVGRRIRFVDLCAGLGGFHHALHLVEARTPGVRFDCVFASELDPELRRLYVENFPRLGRSYRGLFPASESSVLSAELEQSDQGEATAIYDRRGRVAAIHGDLRAFVDLEADELRCWPGTRNPVIPSHHLLCAGFPCQPFSKSGSQHGFRDLRGTVFHYIALILNRHRPPMVFLENVGNFDKHDGGNTWRVVHDTLTNLGYEVAATRHKSSEGEHARGLLSPHHLGHPHHRERFFVIAQQPGLDWLPPINGRSPFPSRPDTPHQGRFADARAAQRLTHIVESSWRDASKADLSQAELSADQVRCVRHWDRLLGMLREVDKKGVSPSMRDTMPSFPIWGYELDPWQWYPYAQNPSLFLPPGKPLAKERGRQLELAEMLLSKGTRGSVQLSKHPPAGPRAFLTSRTLDAGSLDAWVDTWPSYASTRDTWPAWKRRFIEQNRRWALGLWACLDPRELRRWLDDLYRSVPAPSNQKLEWNCKGERLDLWRHLLQFRPSGLRVKRFRHIPALVAMTSTQIPIVPKSRSERAEGPPKSRRSRYLLPREALQLQGFPATWRHPASRDAAFRAFGNAVHCELVASIVEAWMWGKQPEAE
ncbi:MAG: DNA cytosine methyltransferase [Longimicrobiales bacterium]